MGKGSLWKVDNQHRSNLLQALARAPFPRPTTQNSSSHDVTYKKNNATRLPDPVLFPYLFKKLASNDICSQDFEFDSDVDAAAVAMLSFRHGPIILNHDKRKKKFVVLNFYNDVFVDFFVEFCFNFFFNIETWFRSKTET